MSSTSDQASGSGRAPQSAHAPDRTSTRTDGQRTGGAYGEYEPYPGGGYTEGFTPLAGWLLMLGGLFSFFAGLAVVVRQAYFTSLAGYTTLSHNYAYHWNLGAWGWASLVLGIVVVAAGVCVLFRQEWARWAGVVLAVISGVGSFLFLPFFPVWSIIVIAVDVFIIWALVTARRRQDVY